MNATVSAAHSGQPRSGTPTPAAERNPWITLWVMIIGFFMMLLDTTIVAVANPSIQEGLGVDVGAVIWVTSAYLLAYSVPMLIAGRMGDRFGPRNIYLIGLVPALASTLSGVNPSGLLRLHLYFSSVAILMWPMVFLQLRSVSVRAHRRKNRQW